MSDNYIPFEIQAEIMKKLPVKSLIQFRSVSKSWKHLIDTSDFITHYSGQHTHTQLLLTVSTYDTAESNIKHALVADDDTFPQQQLFLTLPLLGNMLKYPLSLGCSFGLLCWLSNGLDEPMTRAVVWNPSIRKAVLVDVSHGFFMAILGFGVCRETRDPKLLKVKRIRRGVDIDNHVEVFTLSGGVWRSPCNNLPRKSICFCICPVVINGILYFLAFDENSAGKFNLIISFDLTSEKFREVNLPHSLAYGVPTDLSMSERKESLVVIQLVWEANEQVSVVWMMGDGVRESFTKLFTINTYTSRGTIMGFRKSGEPIISVRENVCNTAFNKACSRYFNDLRFNGIWYPVTIYPYVETLLLHDQPNLKMFSLENANVSSAFTKLVLH